MADQELEKLLGFIKSSGNAIKIIADDVPDNVRHSLFEGEMIEGCPSRAAAAEMELRKLKSLIREIQTLEDDLEKHIYAHYKEK